MRLASEYWIAIEAGGTHSRGGFYETTGALQREAEGGPCNPMAYGWDASIDALTSLARVLLAGTDPARTALVVGCAGLVDSDAYIRMGQAVASRLGLAGSRAADDLYPMLYANAREEAAVLVIAGTGSNVLAMEPSGRTAQAGGRGHVFGDDGSAYALGVAALRAASAAIDGMAEPTCLVNDLMAAAGVGDFRLMVPWAGQAGKRDIAALAHVVVAAADRGDIPAARCIDTQARLLAEQVVAACARLGLSGGIPVLGQGGLFAQCPRFVEAFAAALAPHGDFRLEPLRLRGHAAIFRLAFAEPLPPWAADWRNESGRAETALPATEAPDNAPDLDALDAAAIADIMIRHAGEAAEAVQRCAAPLATAIEAAATALRQGARILYFGAGTSGRLGVLDASECPPTFGVDPERVVGVIAGGERALVRSIEGAEDDAAAGRADAAAQKVSTRDFVVGIAASGATPYVIGALEAARAAGAVTALLSGNPNPDAPADIAIALRTGAEALTGSTRLKAGTATKIALNIISTGAFARAGYVYRGRMIGMRPSNAKLRQRAIRMIAELAPDTPVAAAAALDQAGGSIPAAILILRHGLAPADALDRVQSTTSPADALR
jgi:N-acetylmuramic acid 6-phosphate etherase